MPTSLKELRETRDAATSTILRLRDVVEKENRNFTTEEQAEWDKSNKDYNDCDEKIKILERGEAVKSRPTDLPGNEDEQKYAKKRRKERARGDDRDLYVRGWFDFHSGRQVDAECRAAASRLGADIEGRELCIQLPTGFQRAQSVGSNTGGGYLRNSEFVAQLERSMLDYSGCLQACDVLTTATSRTMLWPTIDDVDNDGTALAENAQAGDVDLTFGQFTMGSYKLTSGVAKVSYELERDSEIPLESLIADMFGERLGRKAESWATNGTGSSQPTGITLGTVLGRTAPLPTSITANDLIELQHSIDPAYRSAPGCAWMMHDSIAKAIRLLKDDNDQFLWLPGLRDGTPETLLGKPIFINQKMPSSLAAAGKPIIFGDLKKHKIRRVGGVRIRRLAERFGDYDQVGYVAFLEMDSKTLNAGGDPIKHILMAS